MTTDPRPILLIVEDHLDTRQMYAEFLGLSFDVVQAADVYQALEVLDAQLPAVVITDLSLPGLDGFELIKRIRANHATRKLPVICLSGHAGGPYEEQARTAGFDRVLVKPCMPDALAGAALEMIRQGRRRH